MLVKPRVYRHILYNLTDHGWQTRLRASSTAAPGPVPLGVHARRWLALVLVESYLAWLAQCVRPLLTAGAAVPPWARWLLGGVGALRAALATAAPLAAQHGAVVAAGAVLRRRARRAAAAYAWYLPSVAMLYANLGTLLLLSVRLVFAGALDAGPDSRVEWVVRHLMGGMSAGVALAGASVD